MVLCPCLSRRPGGVATEDRPPQFRLIGTCRAPDAPRPSNVVAERPAVREGYHHGREGRNANRKARSTPGARRRQAAPLDLRRRLCRSGSPEQARSQHRSRPRLRDRRMPERHARGGGPAPQHRRARVQARPRGGKARGPPAGIGRARASEGLPGHRQDRRAGRRRPCARRQRTTPRSTARR